MSIERRLEDLSEQVERLRAALEALGPGDPPARRSATGRTPRSTGPRWRRAATPGATRRGVPGNGRALAAVAIAGASGAGLATSATLSHVASEATTLSAECEDTLPQVTAIDPAAGAAEGEDTAPATGADRALHELRRELTAALRNGRSSRPVASHSQPGNSGAAPPVASARWVPFGGAPPIVAGHARVRTRRDHKRACVGTAPAAVLLSSQCMSRTRRVDRTKA
jgi:hypothetical protein